MADPLNPFNVIGNIYLGIDIANAASAQANQSAQDAAITHLATACQDAAGIFVSLPFDEFPAIAVPIALAVAKASENACSAISPQVVQFFTNAFNSAETAAQNQSSNFDNSQNEFNDFGDLINYSSIGDLVDATSAATMLIDSQPISGLTINANGTFGDSQTNSSDDWTSSQVQYNASFEPTAETVQWQNGITTSIQLVSNTVGVTLTDADNGSSMGFSLAGAPEIETAIDNTAVTADISAILVGMNGATITGSSGANVLLALGANGTVNGGGGADQVGVDATGVTVNDNGAAVTAANDAGLGHRDCIDRPWEVREERDRICSSRFCSILKRYGQTSD